MHIFLIPLNFGKFQIPVVGNLFGTIFVSKNNSSLPREISNNLEFGIFPKISPPPLDRESISQRDTISRWQVAVRNENWQTAGWSVNRNAISRHEERRGVDPVGRGLIHDDRKLEARAILQCLFDESVCA